MIVNNKLTKPGGIRRVDLLPDAVHIKTSAGQDRIYKLASTNTDNIRQEASNATIHKFPVNS